MPQLAEQTAPRLFKSYGHDSVAHKDRVLALADRLRRDGIDAKIDQYNAVPLDGWPMWTEREIRKADFVAVVCTETYPRRVGGPESPGKGRGVLWEAKLIYNSLYPEDFGVQKFIPILFEGDKGVTKQSRLDSRMSLGFKSGFLSTKLKAASTVHKAFSVWSGQHKRSYRHRSLPRA